MAIEIKNAFRANPFLCVNYGLVCKPFDSVSKYSSPKNATKSFNFTSDSVHAYDRPTSEKNKYSWDHLRESYRPRCLFSFYWKINCIFSDIGNVMRWADNLKIFVDVSIRILVFPQSIFAARMTRWMMISFVISGNDSLNVSHYPIIFLTGNYDVHGRENELKKKKKKNSNAITRSSTDMSFHYMHSLQTFSRFLCLCFVATK